MRNKSIPTTDDLRRSLSAQISSLPDDKLFELIGMIRDSEDDILKLPEGTFSCKECVNTFGKCLESQEVFNDNEPKCKDKFLAYHASFEQGIAR